MAAAKKAKALEANEFREVLDRALRELDRDERSGPLLRAAGLSLRIELTDLDLVVRVAASEESDHHLRWSFNEGSGPAKLVLRMDSETANAYLQGEESLAIAIARGKVRTSGDSRVALLYLPAMRLVVEPYRRSVRERFPHMALT
jgi:SCP-2 sterol transfer family